MSVESEMCAFLMFINNTLNNWKSLLPGNCGIPTQTNWHCYSVIQYFSALFLFLNATFNHLSPIITLTCHHFPSLPPGNVDVGNTEKILCCKTAGQCSRCFFFFFFLTASFIFCSFVLPLTFAIAFPIFLLQMNIWKIGKFLRVIMSKLRFFPCKFLIK